SSNLPHRWKNDKDFYKGNKDLYVDAYVIHFLENALGEDFFELPEFTHIKKLFALGCQGLRVIGKDRQAIAGMVKKVVNADGVDRLVLFLKTLDMIGRTKDYELLSSPGYVSTINSLDTERINKVINFI